MTSDVPNLRFKEFEGEWKELGLSELLDFKNGLNPKPNKFGKGIKFISVMDILNNAVITYDCIKASVDVTEKELSDFSVEKGDILFQRSSETLEDVGRANVYMDDKTAVFGGFVIRGKKKGEYEKYKLIQDRSYISDFDRFNNDDDDMPLLPFDLNPKEN